MEIISGMDCRVHFFVFAFLLLWWRIISRSAVGTLSLSLETEVDASIWKHSNSGRRLQNNKTNFVQEESVAQGHVSFYSCTRAIRIIGTWVIFREIDCPRPEHGGQSRHYCRLTSVFAKKLSLSAMFYGQKCWAEPNFKSSHFLLVSVNSREDRVDIGLVR